MRHVIAAAGIVGLLLGQLPSESLGVALFPRMLVEFSALGVLAWYCYYVTKTTIPSITREFRQEAEKQRESDSKRVEMVCKSQERQITQISGVMQEMVRHCAARGMSPGGEGRADDGVRG